MALRTALAQGGSGASRRIGELASEQAKAGFQVEHPTRASAPA
jgi:hypothetical protein